MVNVLLEFEEPPDVEQKANSSIYVPQVSPAAIHIHPLRGYYTGPFYDRTAQTRGPKSVVDHRDTEVTALQRAVKLIQLVHSLRVLGALCGSAFFLPKNPFRKLRIPQSEIRNGHYPKKSHDANSHVCSNLMSHVHSSLPFLHSV